MLRGRTLAAEDQRVLAAFATQVAVAYAAAPAGRGRRRGRPAGREPTASATALLNAVSHDLRTPIASAKAAVSSLRSTDIAWSDDDRDELLATADAALDRLTALVTNLLDLSRIQAGVLRGQHRGRRTWPRSSPSAWATWRPTTSAAGCASTSDVPDDTARGRWPTPVCSNGSSPTWSTTPCATARTARP